MEAAEKSVQEKKKASGRLQQAQPKASSAEKKKKAKKEKQAKAGSDCKKRGHSSSTPTSDETDKHQTWKPSAHALPTDDQEPHTSKSSSTRKETRKAAKKEQRKALSSSSSSSSSANMVQELSSQMNESLRWEGVLDDPLAEEERIRQYKLNRRRRYMLAAVSESTTPAKITQQATMDNRQSLQQHPLPVLSKDYRLLSKKDHSNAYFLEHPDQRVRNAELGIKLTPLQSPALVRISQEAV